MKRSPIADQRALIGGEMNKADNQATLLANRKLLLTENIGDMEDADLAEIDKATVSYGQQGCGAAGICLASAK